MATYNTYRRADTSLDFPAEITPDGIMVGDKLLPVTNHKRILWAMRETLRKGSAATVTETDGDNWLRMRYDTRKRALTIECNGTVFVLNRDDVDRIVPKRETAQREPAPAEKYTRKSKHKMTTRIGRGWKVGAHGRGFTFGLRHVRQYHDKFDEHDFTSDMLYMPVRGSTVRSLECAVLPYYGVIIDFNGAILAVEDARTAMAELRTGEWLYATWLRGDKIDREAAMRIVRRDDGLVTLYNEESNIDMQILIKSDISDFLNLADAIDALWSLGLTQD